MKNAPPFPVIRARVKHSPPKTFCPSVNLGTHKSKAISGLYIHRISPALKQSLSQVAPKDKESKNCPKLTYIAIFSSDTARSAHFTMAESSTPNLLMVEGTFYDQADELAQYIDNLNQPQDTLSAQIAPLIESEEKDEVVKRLVEASSALSSAPEKGIYIQTKPLHGRWGS